MLLLKKIRQEIQKEKVGKMESRNMASIKGYNVSKTRNALIDSISRITAEELPDIEHVYLPFRQQAALRLRANPIIGASGTGKTFLIKAISDEKFRTKFGIGNELKNTNVDVVSPIKNGIDVYPNKKTFTRLLEQGFLSHEIWKAVLVRYVSKITHSNISCGEWRNVIEWMKDNPEKTSRLFQTAETNLKAENKRVLFLFDTREYCGEDQEETDNIVRGLLKVSLWLNSFPAILPKVFLNTEQFSARVLDFTGLFSSIPSEKAAFKASFFAAEKYAAKD
jgi:hypothetical protein